MAESRRGPKRKRPTPLYEDVEAKKKMLENRNVFIGFHIDKWIDMMERLGLNSVGLVTHILHVHDEHCPTCRLASQNEVHKKRRENSSPKPVISLPVASTGDFAELAESCSPLPEPVVETDYAEDYDYIASPHVEPTTELNNEADTSGLTLQMDVEPGEVSEDLVSVKEEPVWDEEYNASLSQSDNSDSCNDSIVPVGQAWQLSNGTTNDDNTLPVTTEIKKEVESVEPQQDKGTSFPLSSKVYLFNTREIHEKFYGLSALMRKKLREIKEEVEDRPGVPTNFQPEMSALQLQHAMPNVEVQSSLSTVQVQSEMPSVQIQRDIHSVSQVQDTSPSQTRQSFTISSSKTAETRPTFQMPIQNRPRFQSPCLFPGAIRPGSQMTSILPVQFRLCYEMPSSIPVQTRPNLKLSSPVSASVPISHHSNMVSLARDAPSNNIHTRNIRNTYQYYVNVDRSVNSATSPEDGNKLTLQYIGTKLNTGTPKILGLERNITVKRQVGGPKKENVYLTKSGKVGRPKEVNVSGKVGRPKKDTLFRTKAGKVGRPRKENSNSTESGIFMEKKSVGRPKKSVEIGRTKSRDSENIQRLFGRLKKKRPVGRPRKYNLITENNGSPAKRPVGRPKKFGLWGNKKYRNIQLKAKDLTPQLQSGAISKRISLTRSALKPSTQTKQNFAVFSEELVPGIGVQTDYFVKPKTLCLSENIPGKMHIASPTQSDKSGKYPVKGNVMGNLSIESPGSSANKPDKSDIRQSSSPTQSNKSDKFQISSPATDKIDAMCPITQTRTNKVNIHDSIMSSPDGRMKILDMSAIVDKCNTSLLQKQLQFTKPVVELRKIDDLSPYSVSPDKKSSEKYCGKMQLKDMTISQSSEGRQQVEEQTKDAFFIHEKPPGEVPINHKRSEEFECCKNLCDKSIVEFIDEYKSVNNCPSDGSPVNSDKQLEQVGDKCAVSDQIDTSRDGYDKTKTTFFIPKHVKPLNKGVMKRGRGRPRKKKDYEFKFSVCPIKPLNKEVIKRGRGRRLKKWDYEDKNGSLCLSVNTEGKSAEPSKTIENDSCNVKGVSSANPDSPKETNTITEVGMGLTDCLAESTEQDKNPNDYPAQRKTSDTDSPVKVKKKSLSSRFQLKVSDLFAMMPTKRQVGRPRYDDVSQYLLGIKSDVKKVAQSKRTNNVLDFDSLESFDVNDVTNDMPLKEEENTHLIETENCLNSEVGVSPPFREDCDLPSSEVANSNSKENEVTQSNGNETLISKSVLSSDDLELKDCENSKSKVLPGETSSVKVGSQLDISLSETTQMSVASQCDNISVNLKNVVFTDMDTEGQQNHVFKRNRGRPRKYKAVVHDIVKVKRPVGRPRKADNMECNPEKF